MSAAIWQPFCLGFNVLNIIVLFSNMEWLQQGYKYVNSESDKNLKHF